MLITFDLDFFDIRLYPPSNHNGIWSLHPHTQKRRERACLVEGCFRKITRRPFSGRAMSQIPELITFDIFGTVLDWKTGLEATCQAADRPIAAGEFDRIVDAQGELEQGDFLDYTEVTARSLRQVLGLRYEVAAQIGKNVGEWPLYPDSRASLHALMNMAPCAAMTNSDHAHGEEIQRQLGMRLSDWLCSEETRVYKPNPQFWILMGQRRNIKPSHRWWHVSAYADYDIAVAGKLGLTTVFVHRPHSRPGAATHSVRDLSELVQLVSRAA